MTYYTEKERGSKGKKFSASKRDSRRDGLQKEAGKKSLKKIEKEAGGEGGGVKERRRGRN